ncbi:MAG TPA: LacI family DNA-binding transcriptional regulator [Nocardioidaceae bacterium]|nr:LacI family DNA-binding transcriptional regulator [Nocardioidaceae bacterium]
MAERAGVSIATVSRVVRDSGTVRPETRERVSRAISELHYTPNQLGRRLAEQTHAANGIVFPDLSGPYYAEVVLGYEDVAADLGRSVLILSTHGRDAAPAMVEDMAGRCDGLVILGRTVADDVVERLARRNTPLVLLARAPIEGVDTVKAENTSAAVRLGQHVIGNGARRIAFVGDPEDSADVSERWVGLQRAVGASEDVVLTLARSGDLGEDAGAAVARQFLASGELPDAFVCANDELALGLMGGLREAGIDVPGQVMVTGWDDVMAARYAGLTTVRQPMRELGATAARLLDELITGSRTEPRHEVLPTELVVRTSSTRPRKES